MINNTRDLYPGTRRRFTVGSYVNTVSQYVSGPYVVSTQTSFDLLYGARERMSKDLLKRTNDKVDKLFQNLAKTFRKEENRILQAQANVLGVSKDKLIEMLNEVGNGDGATRLAEGLSRASQYDLNQKKLNRMMGAETRNFIRKSLSQGQEPIDVPFPDGYVERARSTAKRLSQQTLQEFFDTLELIANSNLFENVIQSNQLKKPIGDLIQFAEEQRQAYNRVFDEPLPPLNEKYYALKANVPHMQYAQGSIAEVFGALTFIQALNTMTKDAKSPRKQEKLQKDIEKVAKQSIVDFVGSTRTGSDRSQGSVDYTVSYQSGIDPIRVDAKAGLSTKRKAKGDYTFDFGTAEMKEEFYKLIKKQPDDLRKYYEMLMVNTYYYGDLYLTGEEQVALLRYVFGNQKNFLEKFRSSEGKYPTLVQSGAEFMRFSDAVANMGSLFYFGGAAGSRTRTAKEMTQLSYDKGYIGLPSAAKMYNLKVSQLYSATGRSTGEAKSVIQGHSKRAVAAISKGGTKNLKMYVNIKGIRSM